MSKKKNSTEIIEMMMALRGHVDFDYDLRKYIHPNSQRKIKAYYKEFQSIQGLKVKIIKKLTPDQIKKARGLSTLQLPMFNFIAVPNPEGDIDIKFEDRGVKIVSKNSEKFFYSFNQRALAKNPEKELDRVGKKIKEEWIIIYTGDSYYRRADNFETIKMLCLKLIYGYDNFSSWLKGLYGVTITGQKLLSQELLENRNFVLAKRAKNKKSKYAKKKGR